MSQMCIVDCQSVPSFQPSCPLSIIGQLEYSTGIRKVDTLCRPVGGRPQVQRRFYRWQEAFVIVGIPNFCPVLLFVNGLPDNNSRNIDNSRTVRY